MPALLFHIVPIFFLALFLKEIGSWNIKIEKNKWNKFSLKMVCSIYLFFFFLFLSFF